MYPVGAFVTVTLYLAPQPHVCDPVMNSAMPGICVRNSQISSVQVCHNQTDHYRNSRRPIAGPERVAGARPICGAVMCRSIPATARGASGAAADGAVNQLPLPTSLAINRRC